MPYKKNASFFEYWLNKSMYCHLELVENHVIYSFIALKVEFLQKLEHLS